MAARAGARLLGSGRIGGECFRIAPAFIRKYPSGGKSVEWLLTGASRTTAMIGSGSMIWFRPPAKYREWWDTEFSRNWKANETLASIWAKHLPPIPHAQPDNDRDHIWTW